MGWFAPSRACESLNCNGVGESLIVHPKAFRMDADGLRIPSYMASYCGSTNTVEVVNYTVSSNYVCHDCKREFK